MVVLHVLSKRRTDLQEDDLAVMRKVVARVYAERREDLEPAAGDAGWRHSCRSATTRSNRHEPRRRVATKHQRRGRRWWRSPTQVGCSDGGATFRLWDAAR